jgi:hypothetical protein
MIRVELNLTGQRATEYLEALDALLHRLERATNRIVDERMSLNGGTVTGDHIQGPIATADETRDEIEAVAEGLTAAKCRLIIEAVQ